MNKGVLLVSPKALGGISKVVATIISDAGLVKDYSFALHPSVCEGNKLKCILFSIVQAIMFPIVLLMHKPIIVHIHTSTKGSFIRKSFYIVFSRILGKKVILHVHPSRFYDYLAKSFGFVKKYIFWVIGMANLIVVLTDDAKDKLIGLGIERSKIRVLPNPIILDGRFADVKIRDKSTLLYLGWIIKEKGVYDLLSAAPLIKKRISDFKLIFCGNKETKKLKNIVMQQGVGDYVNVLGWVDKKERDALLEKSTALILPSYTEGIPNVILEAMAAGIPIIATPVGGIPSILKNNVNCIYHDPGNIQEMADRIIILLLNRDVQEKLSETNREHVKQYEAGKIFESLSTIYNELMCSN